MGHNHKLISAHPSRLRASGYPATVVVWSAEKQAHSTGQQRCQPKFPTVGSPAAVTARSSGHGAPNSPFRHVWAGSSPAMLSRILSARGYQRDLRDIGTQQTGGRLNMQPSGLMNIG